MDTHDLVTVYTVTNPLEAEMIKNALHTEGIKCFLGGNEAAETGVPGVAVRINVPALDADRARKFIEAHDHHRKNLHK